MRSDITVVQETAARGARSAGTTYGASKTYSRGRPEARAGVRHCLSLMAADVDRCGYRSELLSVWAGSKADRRRPIC